MAFEETARQHDHTALRLLPCWPLRIIKREAITAPAHGAERRPDRLHLELRIAIRLFEKLEQIHGQNR